MSSVPRGEFTPETRHRIFVIERIREVLSKEPDLEPWQVAERFGVPEKDAKKLVYAARQHATRGRKDDPVKVGARWGKLVVLALHLGPEGDSKGYDGSYCLVKCDCGGERMVRTRHLRGGYYRSCGVRACIEVPCPVCGRKLFPGFATRAHLRGHKRMRCVTDPQRQPEPTLSRRVAV